MSIREVKAWTITCTMAYGDPTGQETQKPKCANRKVGPYFAEYKSEVEIPEGWGYQHGWGGSHYGYATQDLFCKDCIEKYDIKVGKE